jgi:preprotein translocase subunit SecB
MARKKNIKKEPKTITELDLALEVSDAIDIKDVILVENRCKLFSMSREKNNYTISALTDYKVEEEGKVLLTQVKFKFKARNLQNADIASLEAVYLVVYSQGTDKTFSSEQYMHFADYCSVFHVWPYWREFVQRAIASMGLPPLTLPVYKFGEKLFKEETLIEKKMLEQSKEEKTIEVGPQK